MDTLERLECKFFSLSYLIRSNTLFRYFAAKTVFDYVIIKRLIEAEKMWLPQLSVWINRDFYILVLTLASFIPMFYSLITNRYRRSLYTLYPIAYKLLVLSILRLNLNEMFEIDLWQTVIYGYIALPLYLYPYNFFHQKAHIYNSVWSVHKSHHFSTIIHQGDNGTITASELAFLFFPSFSTQIHCQNLWRFSTLLYVDVHDLDRLSEHDLHHFFHNENLPVPTDFASMMRIFLERFSLSLPEDMADEDRKALFAQLAPALEIYSREDNDLEELNRKLQPFKKLVEPFRI